MIDQLSKFQRVNSCETISELEQAILDFSDPETGLIMGRSKPFNGARMASYVKLVVNLEAPANLLTREFGIRQQALYIRYCKEHNI